MESIAAVQRTANLLAALGGPSSPSLLAESAKFRGICRCIGCTKGLCGVALSGEAFSLFAGAFSSELRELFVSYCIHLQLSSNIGDWSLQSKLSWQAVGSPMIDIHRDLSGEHGSAFCAESLPARE